MLKNIPMLKNILSPKRDALVDLQNIVLMSNYGVN